MGNSHDTPPESQLHTRKVNYERPKCPRCRHNDYVRKKGFWDFDNGRYIQTVQRYHCAKCNFHFNITPREWKHPWEWDFNVSEERYKDD